MIEVNEIAKHFGAIRAVDGIRFSVDDGEVFGFLGPNGAGKTTTLSMIAGLVRPDRGSIVINGCDVWQSPQRAKQMLGLAPQDIALYTDLTARENLRFWGGLYGLSGKSLSSRMDEMLERVGLDGRGREPVKNFSGGMKRRLNLAIGLIHRPSFLLLDEPTVGIDPQARNAILEIVREIAAEGATILYTTHQLFEVEQLCQRIAIMDQGRIIQLGTLDELARVAGNGEVISLRGDFTVEALYAALADMPVRYEEVEAGKAQLSLTHDGLKAVQLLQQLDRGGIAIEDFRLQKPTLESVFLTLTGRSLRD